MASAKSALPVGEYVKLGQSGLRVSVPILGCASFGDKRCHDWAIEEDSALTLLKAAYDKGLNTWDTANSYSNGESERIIGKAIKKFGIPRHKLVILTKCYVTVRENNEPETLALSDLSVLAEYVNQGGLSRKAIFNAVDASLARLQTPYIDLLQIHRFDRTVPIEETMKALHDLVESGKVRHIGASSMWTYQFAMMQHTAEKLGWTKFIGMQSCYNLLYREEEREMIKLCSETGVGLILWSPLAGGLLARAVAASNDTTRGMHSAPLTDADAAIIMRVKELARKRDWSMSQVAATWVRKRVCSPIIGCSSIARIYETLGLKGKELTAQEGANLEEPYQPKHTFGYA